MPYFKKIKGEKVYLSPLSIDDIDKYTKWMADLEITEKFGGFQDPISYESCKDWLESTKNKHQYAIVLEENDEFIGICGFNNVDFVRRLGDISIFIGEKDKRRKGYGSEAINLILMYGFDYLNLNNIMLTVAEFNNAAINLYKKSGFKIFGSRTDAIYLKGKYYNHIYMEITKTNYYSMSSKK